MITLTHLAPTFLTLFIIFVLHWGLPNKPEIGRFVSAFLCIFLFWRFVYFHYTVLPEGNFTTKLWSYTFFFFEAMACLSTTINYFFMSRTKNRSKDVNEKSPMVSKPTDVIIATYNEDNSILEKTILYALNIDHPDLRVFVCDDGRRDEVKDLAKKMGAEYITRSNNDYAKAGNVNNAIKTIATMEGRKPEFLLLLDADFMAMPNILKRTLGFFEDKNVGIVQTPQCFRNADPIQSNLGISSVWPDEQRFFFESLLPSKDAWGAAFCCGTSAVFRFDYLTDIGGFPTETVTEDMLTSFAMREKGYKTIYLNEPLSYGLAPENIEAYLTQRSRWCLGAIQQLYTKYSFFGSNKMGFINRLSFFDIAIFWLFTFKARLLLFLAPTVYLFTGLAVIDTSISELIYYLLPNVVALITFSMIYSKNRLLPIISDVSQLFSTPTIIRAVFSGIFNPKNRKFKVTPKGIDMRKSKIRYDFLWPFVLCVILTFVGICINLTPYSLLRADIGFDQNIMWSMYNTVVFLISAGVSIEMAKTNDTEKLEPYDDIKVHKVMGGLLKYFVK